MTAADPRAKAYHREKLRVLAAGLLLSGALLAVLQFSGLSAALAAWASAPDRPKAVEALLYLAVFFQLTYFVPLPLHFYSGFLVEKKYGLSTQRLVAWLADRVKGYALSFLFFLISMELLLFTLWRFPDTWWLVAGAGWLLVSLFLSRILPTILIPIFYKLKVLPAGELRERLIALIKKCRVRFLDIYEIALSGKTRKANAALVGIGRSRRILLGDTMLERYTHAEIEMVIAHELGHHVKRHIPKTVAFNTVTTLAGFYLLHRFAAPVTGALGGGGLTDLSIFPALVLLASVAGLVLLPLQNALSRRHEYEADRFALETCPSKEVFLSLMTKLGAQNLSDPDPSPVVEWLLYDHPSIPNRIRRAEAQFNA